MIDWQDRLFQDSVLVRFEDGKLNAKATFYRPWRRFLDIPYTESMTYCSADGKLDPESYKGNVRGFDPASVYKTYDEYANDDERYFLEYFCGTPMNITATIFITTTASRWMRQLAVRLPAG